MMSAGEEEEIGTSNVHFGAVQGDGEDACDASCACKAAFAATSPFSCACSAIFDCLAL